ncbi:MAG TPA: Rnf-Nqr domain containing protein [Chitinivibrionales bacterium]|nr:Rnf-Nqr domain containing protein [Chitinivibrionales bacterium]
MNLHALLDLCIASILINNIVLSRLIGVCPCFGRTKKLSDGFGMGIAVTFVMGFTSVFTWAVRRYVLVPASMEYMQTMVFILVIVSLSLLAETGISKLWPALHEKAGVYIPSIAANCAVIALALINAQTNPFTRQPFTLLEAFVNGLATGGGFTLALVLMTGIQQRLEYARIPKALSGFPISLLSAGLMSLAFLGFWGLHFTRVTGG